MKKQDCLYLDGEITLASHGKYIVDLADTPLEAICTARRMEKLRIGLMQGDVVTVEIPLLSMEPNSKRVHGRLVWRHCPN